MAIMFIVPENVITVKDSYIDLKLGDIVMYDCTSGYTQSGVTVQWNTPDGKILSNPLILTVNHSIHNITITCEILVSNNAIMCPTIEKSVLFKVRGM